MDGDAAPATGVIPALALEDAAYDFPSCPGPRFTYMIASTPRSGSNLFCRHIWRTGVMGAPMEYFNFDASLFILGRRFAVDRFPDYLEALLRLRTSPNGVFGFKAHLDQYSFLRMADRARRLRPQRVIFIDRRDVVAQAVSLSRAQQTDQWNSRDPARTRPAYDFDHVAGCVRNLELQKARWDRLFRDRSITPIRIVYEEFTRRSQEAVSELLDLLGIERGSAAEIRLPPIERQADSINADWIARFRAEAAARAKAASTSGSR